MKTYIIYLAVTLAILLVSCGDPAVSVNNNEYVPKIVVEAFVYPGEPVQGIKIMRNVEIGKEIDSSKIFLEPAKNNLEVKINNITLDYNAVTKSFYTNTIKIEPGKTYKLEVKALLDGKMLKAEAETRVPVKGFEITQNDLGLFKYGLNKPKVDFKLSSGCDFYAFSIIADSASVKNFIYENWLNPDMKEDDVKKSFNRYKYQAKYISNINSVNSEKYSFEIEVYDSWFYSPYRIIGYAGDDNFRNFAFTAKNVQEFDGNFHEPIQIFKGDAIGIFASAIKDTVYFKMIK